MSTIGKNRHEARAVKTTRRSLWSLYLVRGVVAVAWAAVFGVVGDRLGTATIALLIIYPAIDVVSSVYDAGTHHATGAARTQWTNAAISAAAALGLAIAGTQNSGRVEIVFGLWATISGLVQLIVAFRRRPQFGNQWAMLISGGLSTVAGIAFTISGHARHPQLQQLSGYALLGGAFFIVNGFVLRRRAAGSPGVISRSLPDNPEVDPS